jgi:hypothetical protein
MKKQIPLERRLARAGRRSDLRLLQGYATPHAPSAWMPANDNEVVSIQVDRIVEIRPSPDEMVRLAAKDAIRARDGYGPITAAELDVPMRARLRIDRRGQITAWLGSDGRWHDTAELFRQPKGKRRKTDEERQADNARHLSIPATGAFPERSGYVVHGSEGQVYRRNRAARWRRHYPHATIIGAGRLTALASAVRTRSGRPGPMRVCRRPVVFQGT